MEESEILIREEGSPEVARYSNLRPLLIRLEGLERHRVLRWLNCCTRPPDSRVPKTAKSSRSPDDSFNRFLRILFFLILSLVIIQILFEFNLGYEMWLIYPLIWSRVTLLVMLAVAVAAFIVKNKMKSTDFTPPRKEEVKTISGLIQQV